jgi:uncharacterized damage-inducible protein DinB
MPIDLENVRTKLEQGRDVIVALCSHLDDDGWRWRPAEGEWSLLEVINHIADEEKEDFRRRIDLLLHHPGTEWPGLDPESWAVKRRYYELDPQQSLQRFVQERAASLAWLQGLSNVDWDATYAHRSGPLRAGDLLVSWLVHDDLHARQMLHIHNERSLTIGAPYSAAYAGAW